MHEDQLAWVLKAVDRVASVLQVKRAKKNSVEVTADLADEGSKKRWFGKGIKYPKCKTKVRYWAEEASFAVPRQIEDEDHLPAREKRTRGLPSTWTKNKNGCYIIETQKKAFHSR